MGDLSTHFDRREFRDSDTGALVEPPERIIWRLEATRALTGRPIRIVSFFRSRSSQRRLYDRLRAQDRSKGRRPRPYVVGYHPQRLAVDVDPGAVTVDQAVAAGWGGIGRRGKWAVHLDDRRGSAPVIFEDPGDG